MSHAVSILFYMNVIVVVFSNIRATAEIDNWSSSWRAIYHTFMICSCFNNVQICYVCWQIKNENVLYCENQEQNQLCWDPFVYAYLCSYGQMGGYKTQTDALNMKAFAFEKIYISDIVQRKIDTIITRPIQTFKHSWAQCSDEFRFHRVQVPLYTKSRDCVSLNTFFFSWK